jgi:hypothetical protein
MVEAVQVRHRKCDEVPTKKCSGDNLGFKKRKKKDMFKNYKSIDDEKEILQNRSNTSQIILGLILIYKGIPYLTH